MLILKKRKHRTARIQCEELIIMNSAKMISLNSEILFKSFKLFVCLNQRDENSMQPIILSHFLLFPKLGDFGQNVQIQKKNKLEYLTNSYVTLLKFQIQIIGSLVWRLQNPKCYWSESNCLEIQLIAMRLLLSTFGNSLKFSPDL